MKSVAGVLLILPVLAVAVALIWWRGPDWHQVRYAFTVVRWAWIVVAIGLNLVSVLVAPLAWDTVISSRSRSRGLAFPLVFSAFSVGLFANAVLPGRVGELARVAVLRRRLAGRKGSTATLLGSVFAHRMFDIFPSAMLVIWVLITAKLPGWAVTSIVIVLALGRRAVRHRARARAAEADRRCSTGSARALMLLRAVRVWRSCATRSPLRRRRVPVPRLGVPAASPSGPRCGGSRSISRSSQPGSCS